MKQGDPISALLLIAVMQACFEELQSKWMKANRRRNGVPFGVCIHLTWKAMKIVEVDGQCVEILDEEANERYLGRKLAFHASQDNEIRNRIVAGWAAAQEGSSATYAEVCFPDISQKPRRRR